MDVLKRQRGGIKASLTNFGKYIDDNFKNKSGFSKELIFELENRINGAEANLLHRFSEIQNQIETECQDADLEKEYTERCDFENKYYSLLSLGKKYLHENKNNEDKSSDSSSHATTGVGILQNVKLPDINLPIFDGSLHNWLEFRDVFESLIHNNESISDIQRFHYLRASVRSEPAQIISTIEFSSSNYKVAWDMLGKRYNNDKMLIHNHIKNIFNIEPIVKESAKGIRNILNDLIKNLRALSQIGLPTNEWDVPIVYLINTKLDRVTNRDWETFKSKCKGFPTLEDLKVFLNSKAELLDNLEQNRAEKLSDRQSTRGLLLTDQEKFYGSSNNVNEKCPKCTFCKSEHYIQSCPQFLKIPVEKRAESIISLKLCLNCLKAGHFNRNCRRPTCKICHGKHHFLLHLNKPKEPTSSNIVTSETNRVSNQNISNQNISNMSLPSNGNVTSNNSASCEISNVLLSTAQVDILDQNGKKQTIRIILDSGSQSSFITEQAVNRLGLNQEKVNFSLNGINGSYSHIGYKCKTNVFSKTNGFSVTMCCFVIPKITGILPISKIDISKLKIPEKYKLADPTFFQPQQVDMLIGADYFWEIISNEKISLGSNAPILQDTYFGWLVTGPLGNNAQNKIVSCNFNSIIEQQIQDDLKKFWELESCDSIENCWSQEEIACEEHFIKNTTRSENGGFVVKLPLRMDVNKLGNSLDPATKRFLSLERKFNSNENYKQLYHEFIQEYIDLGHMSKVNDNHNKSPNYFMSHHGVYRQDVLTTNLRVVYDASLPSCTGYSLNHILMVGPSIQPDLFSILIKFRQHCFVVAADCTKMYRSVLVAPEDRHLQQILWRFNDNSPIDTYQLNTVTYGTAPASFLAIRCLFELAKEVELKHPDIAQIIKQDFYVDDLLTGAETVDEARRITKLVFDTLKEGCFILRKFFSNNDSILDCIPNNDPLSKIVEFGENDRKKTLGLIWCPATDKLMFNVNNIGESKNITKRVILSNSSKIFDPLGLISPCVIKIKMLLQSLWLEKLSWDDQVPINIATEWINFRSELSCLENLKINRHAIIKNKKYVEMHCFSDSSEKAFGAAVYLKSVDDNGKIEINLLASKAKVAPLQSVSLARLELCGAVVAARLANKISKALRIEIEKRYFWTDSTIVLGWVKTPPNKLKTFVANRVSEIQTLTNSDIWRHVPSQFNPSDYLSRGVKCSEIGYLDMWWHGPQFLYLSKSEWPQDPCHVLNLPDLRKIKTVCTTTVLNTPNINNIIEQFSDLTKLKRIVTLLQRFIFNCKNLKVHRKIGILFKIEIDVAFNLMLKQVQHQCFEKEIKEIKSKKLKVTCKFLNLNPFLDENDFLRVGGRLANARFSFEKKHPLILAPDHPLTRLILRHEHVKLYHCGPQHLLASIRERYWPISGRSLSKKIVHECVKCSRYKPNILKPIMGNLPEQRLNPKHPFDIVGVDYAGPFFLKDRKGKNPKISKCYVALYVCFLTKAVHLELVTDLTAASFILSLRRFCSRRGAPSVVFSDNGSNFIGAQSELKELGIFIRDHELTLTSGLCKEEVDWHFIPPQSPHFGGLWEAGVKTMKHHLKRVIHNMSLTFEHFYTLLTEIEAIMNSRPLSTLSSNPEDLTPLTPSHFLIGRPLSSIPSPDVRYLPTNRLSLYQHLQQMKQHIWNRWSKEYVSELQVRQKWKQNYNSLKEGAIVLVKDDNTPPMKWKMGKVITVFPGTDKIARVALIKTEFGLIKRCFSKICPLPIND